MHDEVVPMKPVPSKWPAGHGLPKTVPHGFPGET